MTRRDYVLLSAALAGARQYIIDDCERHRDALLGLDIGARAIADALAAQSRGFDRERFLDATGTESLAPCGPCQCSDCKPVK
jgi:hypothetical protein